MRSKRNLVTVMMIWLAFTLIAASFLPRPRAQADNPNPPEQPVKLIFIHHSTGENWLTAHARPEQLLRQ